MPPVGRPLRIASRRIYDLKQTTSGSIHDQFRLMFSKVCAILQATINHGGLNMSSVRSRIGAVVLAAAIATGAGLVAAAPAQALSARCDYLGTDFQTIKGVCRAATGNNTVHIQYTCWGLPWTYGVDIYVGYTTVPQSFSKRVNCGFTGLTGVWLAG